MADLWPGGRAAAVTITFDGGYTSSVRHALPLLEAYRFPSTWFLVAGSIGGQLEGRDVAGWDLWQGVNPDLVEVGNHSLTHPLVRRSFGDLSRRVVESPSVLLRAARRAASSSQVASCEVGELSEAQTHRMSTTAAVSDFSAGKELLETNLRRRVSAFAYPNGRARRSLVRGVAGMGHDSARTSEVGFNDPRDFRALALRAQTWTTSTRPAETEEWIDRVTRSGGWLIEVLHVVDASTSYPWTTTPDDLAQHLDSLERANVWVATQSAVASHLSRIESSDRAGRRV